ncbi:MAG: hypothetical protein BroJett021_18770 [Chloroflexota bacterium]|nr:MAG: hypothetical protein BroJett021_18770 [Chloroflexota bacterium]
MAVIFGLILPFICWGAEATPGHPHMRAHFVFLAPVHNVRHAESNPTNAHDLLRATANDLAIGVHDLCARPSAAQSRSTPPVSQSTPLMLAITLLMLAAISIGAAPTRRDDAGFFLRPGSFFPRLLLREVATPPPRLLVSV